MSFSRHLFDGLERQGVTIDRKGDIRLEVMPPYYYNKWRFKFNVLFTMWEFDGLPEDWRYTLESPELLIVPCVHNQELFKQVRRKPIEVCHLGVDEQYYQFQAREKKKPFVFLYVGDKNVRKGICHISEAWNDWNKTEYGKNCILVLKITDDEKQELKQIDKNVFIDNRVLPFYPNESGIPTMLELYQYANAFLFPTMGEGFGLTLAEAMATGLPCIYTPWSGPVDFCSEAEGYPVDYGFKPFDIMRHDGEKVGRANYATPYKESIVEQMTEVYTNYHEALKKGKAASEKIHKYFTWDIAAKRLIRLISRHKEGSWV